MVTMLSGALVLSLLGSVHCMGMCGGFALIAKGPVKGFFSIPLVSYFAGKTASYSALGFLFGVFGQSLHSSPLGSKLLAMVVGLVMIWIGLEMAGVRRVRPREGGSKSSNRFSPSWLIAKLQQMAAGRGMWSRAALGVLNGLLPCGLLYAAFAGAAQTGSGVDGALFMMVFGLGTLPSLFFMANVSELLSIKSRSILSQASGWLIVIFGILTMLRGSGIMATMNH